MPIVAPTAIRERIGIAKAESGLRIPGLFVWCSSVIEVEGKWHMFSAAWPERGDRRYWTKYGVLQNYLEESTIVRGVADNPEGPYEYQETVFTSRGSGFWDVKCCHNPFVMKTGGKFVVFFQACGEQGEPRRIGCASADSVEGPWVYEPEAIPFPWDAVNPSVWEEEDGSLLMAFRRDPSRLAMARAPSFKGPWEVLNDDLMPHYVLEDPFLFHWHGQYHMLLEDCGDMVTGDRRNGVHLVSDNAIDWHFHEPEIRPYGGLIEWDNGAETMPARRERPFLILQDGEPTHLVTGVLFPNFKARSVVVPIHPAVGK